VKIYQKERSLLEAGYVCRQENDLHVLARLIKRRTAYERLIATVGKKLQTSNDQQTSLFQIRKD
jgi:hypothetical protein